MNVYLLYPDRDWTSQKSYYDWDGIVKDLGLSTIFEMSQSDLVMKGDKVMYIGREDKFLGDTLRKIMRVPLASKEEMLYRQEIMKDCFRSKEYVDQLYEHTTELLAEWERLGRRSNANVRDTRSGIVTEIKVLKLLSDGMMEVKKLLKADIENGHFKSRGFVDLKERLEEEYPKNLQKQIEAILGDLNFYIDTSEYTHDRTSYLLSKLPKISFDCGLYEGMKLTDIRLDSIETIEKVYTDPNSIKAKIQGKLDSMNKNTISLYSTPSIYEDATKLEYEAVNYVMSCVSGVMYEMGRFFDQLNLQLGFYKAATNLKNKIELRYGMETCFPIFSENKELSYTELHEIVMRVEQGGTTVGNSGSLGDKLLTIITGANQGGKSTFLRSIGIAQVMMQCGLIVCARGYCSGLYQNFFTHFTRREDSAMNSGRLDEELRRMNNIINHIGHNSMILLNESFATTTEKEGSAIAYDISKALVEQGVRIITVTHLLSYAKRVYSEEIIDKEPMKVVFLSAEHKDNGERTYKIIPHEPELTSFGLELYDSVLRMVSAQL